MGSSIANVGTYDAPNISSKCKIKIEIGQSNNTHLDSISECKPSNLGEALPLNLQERKKYGCKFCESAFSCRFGLSGHQNVHKQEWAMERAAKKAQKDFSREKKWYKYKVAISSPYPTSVTCFSNRPSTNKPCQVQNYRTNMRNFMVGPTMPVGRMAYLTNNVPRYSRVFRGWNNLVPITSQFIGAPLITRHDHVSTSLVMVRDKFKKRTPVHNQRAIAPRNFRAQINNLANEEVSADSGLDLELRL